MAKTQNPFFGRMTKSIANVTTYTLKGSNIVRSKPVVVANPRTEAQRRQREALSFASSYIASIAIYINAAYKRQRSTQFERALGVQELLKHLAIATIGGQIEVERPDTWIGLSFGQNDLNTGSLTVDAIQDNEILLSRALTATEAANYRFFAFQSQSDLQDNKAAVAIGNLQGTTTASVAAPGINSAFGGGMVLIVDITTGQTRNFGYDN